MGVLKEKLFRVIEGVIDSDTKLTSFSMSDGMRHKKFEVQFNRYTWSVQKVSRILNFRGLRIFDFRFFCGVMLVLMFLTYADKFGHFECSVNFWQLFCLDVFWLVFDFCLFQKMEQRICIKFCLTNKIKCADAFRMLTVAYSEATLDSLARHSGSPRSKKARQVRSNVKVLLTVSSIAGAWCIMSSCHRVERSIRNITCMLCAICAKQSARNTQIRGRTKIGFCTMITPLLTHRCLCANFWSKTTH